MKRIKRALAAFLKDELLEFIGYRHDIPTFLSGSAIIKNYECDVVKMERVIDINTDFATNFHQREIQDSFELKIEETKKEFARELLKYMHVETKQLVNPSHWDRRSIRLEIVVAKTPN